ncbi:MAG: response regulator transcription factor [Thermodesulfovibrionales bacterium]
MITVVIVDDHVIFRQGLLKLLQSAENIEVVADTGSSDEALRVIIEKMPHVAILDISMPVLNGIELLQEIQRKAIGTKIVFLTMHNDPVTAKKAIQSNASGYVLKDDAFEDLLYAVRAVASGGTFISPSISEKVLSAKVADSEDRLLTKREREVLRLIALGSANKKIADTLSISVKTVETHRTRILKKLDAHNTADLVRYAIKTGLLEV